MDEMQIDVEEIRFAIGAPDDVIVPDLFEEGSCGGHLNPPWEKGGAYLRRGSEVAKVKGSDGADRILPPCSWRSSWHCR
jgi:hypothetical protein